MRVAVLGTGIMGSAMARNIARAGHDVVVWNRTREKAEATGLEVANTPRDAARGANAVVTMLPAAEIVEEAVREVDFGDALWLQTSTVGLGIERLAALADEKGIALVDAPVLGTKEPAEKGELVVFASGPRDERADAVFDAIGRKTIWLGDDPGRASRFKVVVNAWLLSLVEGLAETLALAEAQGFDGRQFLEAIAGGPLDLPYAQLKGKAMLAHEYPPSFPLRLAAKDARLVLEAAADAGVELAGLRATAAQFERAAVERGDDDLAAVYEVTRVGETAPPAPRRRARRRGT
jgi:3-hydroxyisobutyrate dehydrogenase